MDLLLTVKLFLTFIFIVFWFLLYRMIDYIMENPKLNKLRRMIVGVVFAAGMLCVLKITNSSVVLYFLMLMLLFVGFILFYKDKIGQALFCTGACILNLLSIRTIAIGVVSLVMDRSVLEVEHEPLLLISYLVLAFFLTNIAMLLVTKFVPLNYLRVINKHKEQLWFLLAWMVINISYLFMEMGVLEKSSVNPAHPVNGIVASICILAGFYIVLFFAIKTSSLLGYKEKNMELELAMVQEQRYRNSITKDAITTYEINVTKDVVLNGLEDLKEELGDIAMGYSDTVNFMTRKWIYSDDIEKFTKYAEAENLFKLFQSGKSESSVEYRRLLESGEYAWVSAVTNLLKDEKTDDLIAFVCIRNIDRRKRRQLELEYKAERDALTGLYNKEITGKLVDEHLMSEDSQMGSILFMIDVDNFKEINDNLSHVYGDAVLCELADKLRNIFSSDDIVGRIGGDEFIAFMKNCDLAEKAKEKAENIIKEFYITYNGLNDEGHTISGSVGIAFYPKDGENFAQLYKSADAALYSAKAKGKNTYDLYDGSEFAGYYANRTEINSSGTVSQKNFRQNRIEYVFKMLYQSDNSAEAIHSVLELVARHFSFARGYIFETSKDGKTTSNTFEWCASGVEPQIDVLQQVPIAAVATANSRFYDTGTFILRRLEELQPEERAVLEPQGIKSMFQFGIFDKSYLLGFIGFDNCMNEIIPDDTEIDEIATICNILATFFVKQHMDEVAAMDFKSRQEVMDHLDNYIYVVNMETFEVLFMNEKTKNVMNADSSGTSTCYSFFRGNEGQCEDCPMRQMNGDGSENIVCEIYNEKLEIWTETRASTLRWTDGGHACLINCADITKQKSEHLQHINQLEQLAYVDELTGCRTYGKFKEDARFILEQHQDSLHLIVKLDVDNFKLINQMFGYEKGNDILRCIAKAIETTLSNEDGIYARMGNDEFIILIAIESTDEISEAYERFLHNVGLLIGDDFPFRMNFPHGRYIVDPRDEEPIDITEMFEKVNIAHKAAKLDKSASFVWYNENMTKDALHQKEVENKMENALQEEEFIIYLQPKYYLEGEQIGGAEALARWKNENADLFSPGAFVPIFERNGFIIRLDFYILRKVCTILREWMDQGLEPIVISVNFSRLHLRNVNFVKDLCEIVDEYGIERKYIEIELTETVFYDNIQTLEVLLEEMHQAGFTMSMDDFGSGYSSLGVLQNLPVDVIKMDRSFFVNQKDAKRSKAVVSSVIDMAASLGIGIVAEGVEEKVHIDLLRELNCGMVQGYYYEKPVPVERFAELMELQRQKNKTSRI